MKNRRTILIAFVLVAALCVGVGYAALTDTLTIGGTIKANENILDASVHFESYEITGKPAGADDPTITVNNDTISVTIPEGILVNEGDFISFNATVAYTYTGAGAGAGLGEVTITRGPISEGTHFAVTTNSEVYNIAQPATGNTNTAVIQVTITAGDLSDVDENYSETFTIPFTVTCANNP